MAVGCFGWIEACLRYAGRFGPREKMTYRDIFQVSAPSVSRHQKCVARALEEACAIHLFEQDDRGRLSGGKLILRADAKLPKEPVFGRVPSLERWLQDTFDGTYFHSVEIERAEPEPDIIRPIVRALEDAVPLIIQYHSRKGSGNKSVSPHAIVRIAERLHMRAYDHSSNQYRDFVLSRIQAAQLLAEEPTSYVGNDHDKDWHDFVAVEVREKPSCDPNATLGVRMDYSLDDNGRKTIRVRKALASYVVDIDDDDFTAPITVKLQAKQR